MLSQETITELQTIFKEEFGIEYSYEDSAVAASQLVQLAGVLKEINENKNE